MKPLLIIVLFLSAFQLSAQNNYYTQGKSNRVAAEWEPALGTMIVWPLSIPYKLVVELANDNHLYTLVQNDSTKAIALKWYTAWGIDPSKNTFIYAPAGIDSWWTRDWGPSAVFTPDKKMELGDGKYTYSTPVSDIGCDDSLEFIYMNADKKIIKTETDDSASVYVGAALHTEVLDLPFANTGGNVLTDGLGSAFSTCILLQENKFRGLSVDQFFQLNKNLLGLNNYHIISNFEKRSIQHIDCFMKVLDEERILVAEPPSDHPEYAIYQNIVDNELAKLKTPYGRPYEIIRIKTDRYSKDRLAAYTNSLILNQTIYVPLFQISQDSLALERWREVMPGYTVKGFYFLLAHEPLVDANVKDHYKIYGWNSGDALHCRTRAVWDPQMIFITTKRIKNIVDSKHKNHVYSTIIDYSGKGLDLKKTMLFWRVSGQKGWNQIALKQTDAVDHFSVEIPFHKSGCTIEYYISAVSKSGQKETAPRTAPGGLFNFFIQ